MNDYLRNKINKKVTAYYIYRDGYFTGYLKNWFFVDNGYFVVITREDNSETCIKMDFIRLEFVK